MLLGLSMSLASVVVAVASVMGAIGARVVPDALGDVLHAVRLRPPAEDGGGQQYQDDGRGVGLGELLNHRRLPRPEDGRFPASGRARSARTGSTGRPAAKTAAPPPRSRTSRAARPTRS